MAPQEEYIKSAEASKDKKLPSVGTSLAPIILPLVLIFLNTGINAMFPDTTVAKVFKFVGSPLAALLAGCLFSLVLTGAEWRSKKVMNDWVESALRSSAMPIMVTAMGGALAAFIKNAGVANAWPKPWCSSASPASSSRSSSPRSSTSSPAPTPSAS